MKARTNDFKEAIKELKEISSKITYTINGVATELGDEELNSVQPHYQGSLLKSIMKELDLDSNVEIPNETIINFQFGVKVREASGNDDGYDYINYGHYVVYSSEKQEDTNSYLIKCYDKMLYSMVDYETIKYRNLFDNIFRQGTQSSTTTGNRIVNNNNFKLKANTTYTISTNLSSDYKFAVTLNDSPLPNSATNFYDSGWVTNQVKTFTPSRDGYIGILVCKSNGTDALTPSSIANYIFQLELGSTATEYEPFGNIQYPISIRKYIDLLCFNIGLVFKNKNDYFTNYDKIIDNELYLDSNGNSLGYKFRDVLDELAQVTGSIICINEEDDELEVRYPSNADETRTSVSGKDLTLANVDDIKVDDITLTGETTQASTPSPSSPQEVVNVTGLQNIKAVGKNLADISKIAIGKSWSGVTSTQRATILWLPIKANQKYNFVSSWTNSSITNIRVVLNHGSSDQTNNLVVSSFPFTNTTWEYASIEVLANTTFTSAMLDGVKIMLCKGEDSDYEPYQEQVNEINLGKNLFIPTTQVSGTDIVVANGTVTLNDDEFTLNATGNDCYFGQVTASGNAYTNNRGILIDVSGMTNVTFSLTNTQFNNIYITAYNNSKTSLGYTNFTSYKGTYTIPTNAKYISIRFGLSNAVSGTSYSTKVQIEKGTQATSYSEYFTPIELCKIGTYQDKIFKNSGKNLASPSNINMQCGLNDSGAMYSGATTRVCVYKVPIKPSTTYSLSCENGYQIGNVFQYDSGGTYTDTVSSSYARTKQYTSSSTTYYISFVLKNDGNTTINVSEKDNLHIQIEKSSSATEYEPYSNNEWYVKKNIGKVVLDGTENWTAFNSKCYYTSLTNALRENAYSNYYKRVVNVWDTANNGIDFLNYSGAMRLFLQNADITSVSNLKTWLSTHNTIVYYVLSTPTYEKLNDTLQEELNNILLLEGLNNVTTSVPINLNYVSDMDTIDEEFFDESNVNFGEVYGPVNTIILSRSAESDELAKSLVENEEDRIAIKISDNQILNFDGREEYLDGLLNRLSGTMYVQNDYTSKGICYYNIGDRYKAYIFGKYYRCLMLNDDVTIESGLSENVFTEIPETAETDYSKTSASDKTVRKANLIVNKQLGEITAEVETLDTSINGANGISSKLTTQGQTIDLWSKSFDDNGNVVALNTTNYTFDNEGLKIGKSTDDYNSLQDNTGTYYYEKDTMTGKYTKDGSVQKNMALFGKYYYGIDEEGFNVESFARDDALFLAQLYTDSNNEQGFGHFYNSNE